VVDVPGLRIKEGNILAAGEREVAIKGEAPGMFEEKGEIKEGTDFEALEF